jgi:hypothetical protein
MGWLDIADGLRLAGHPMLGAIWHHGLVGPHAAILPTGPCDSQVGSRVHRVKHVCSRANGSSHGCRWLACAGGEPERVPQRLQQPRRLQQAQLHLHVRSQCKLLHVVILYESVASSPLYKGLVPVTPVSHPVRPPQLPRRLRGPGLQHEVVPDGQGLVRRAHGQGQGPRPRRPLLQPRRLRLGHR